MRNESSPISSTYLSSSLKNKNAFLCLLFSIIGLIIPIFLIFSLIIGLIGYGAMKKSNNSLRDKKYIVIGMTISAAAIVIGLSIMVFFLYLQTHPDVDKRTLAEYKKNYNNIQDLDEIAKAWLLYRDEKGAAPKTFQELVKSEFLDENKLSKTNTTGYSIVSIKEYDSNKFSPDWIIAIQNPTEDNNMNGGYLLFSDGRYLLINLDAKKYKDFYNAVLVKGSQALPNLSKE